MQTVSVMPTGNGWIVRTDGIQNDQVFRSGAAAEAAAVKLAEAISAPGKPVEIRVALKDGSQAKRFAVRESTSAAPTGWTIERHGRALEAAVG
jgi:hypothetical protein